jgi:hypothetical protein
MQAEYTGQPQEISEAQRYCGKLRRSDPLTKIYMAGVQERLHTKAAGLLEAGNDAEYASVRSLLDEINQWLSPSRR